jgi:hypothetical protein
MVVSYFSNKDRPVSKEAVKEVVMASPPTAVGGAWLAGITINDIAAVLAIVYTLGLIIAKSPAIYEAIRWWLRKFRRNDG